MSKIFSVLIITSLAVGAGAFENFGKYADTAALQAKWRGFGGGNPAPTVSLAENGGRLVMRLATAGGAGDKVIVREFAGAPKSEIRFRVKAAAATPAAANFYVAVRQQRDGGNLALDAFQFTPGEWQEVVIPNAGRFQWENNYAVLFCIHDAGAPVSLLLEGIDTPDNAVPAAAGDRLETFDYADSAGLNKVWRGYGGDNPIPAAEPAAEDGEKVMRLVTAGGPNDKIIFRDFEAEPGSELRVRIKAAADAPAGTYGYLALRTDANASNLVISDFQFTPGEWQEVVIPNAGRFAFDGRFTLLICLHDAGKPLTVSIGAITMPNRRPAPVSFRDSPEQKKNRVNQLLTARTVQIDTGFPYYQNRSIESIASEIRVNGFDGVYYYVMYDHAIRPGLVAEMQRQRLAVALMTLPNLVYWSEEAMAAKLPPNFRDWMLKFTGPDMDQYRFIGFVYPEYNAWYKPYLGGMLTKHNFDGFTFAEIMYPIYNGPERTPPFYGDVSPNFQQAFQAATGNTAFPDFTDPASLNYFETNTELYADLVEYRVKTINDFYDDIVNGPGGAREAAPDITFATWTLGINIPDGVDKLREWEGNDITAMIRQVRPDVHFIQTHAPDWSNPALPADYPLSYQPFFDAVRNADPKVKIAMQADFGSLGVMRRNPEWVAAYYDACRQAGVASTTYYEFSIRYEVYSLAPELKEVRLKTDRLQLVFDQRLGRESAAVMAGRQLTAYGDRFTVQEAEADGNLLLLKLDRLPRAGALLSLPVGGVMDDPAVRLNLSNLPPFPQGPVNTIAADAVVTLPVLSE